MSFGFWKLARFWICIWFAKAWHGVGQHRSVCLSVSPSISAGQDLGSYGCQSLWLWLEWVGDWDSLTRRLRSFPPLDLWQEIGQATTATSLGNCRYIFQMHFSLNKFVFVQKNIYFLAAIWKMFEDFCLISKRSWLIQFTFVIGFFQ